jgi:hypothetical protein
MIMECLSKSLSLLIILFLAVPSITLIKTTFAQEIPAPSVPEFTVQLVGPAFKRNTTYSLDSNTGQIVANIGYTNEYSYVVLTIKNQLFSPSEGSLYYNIQIKNQNTSYKNWTVVTYDGPNPNQTIDSAFTNISLRIEGQRGVQSLAGTQTDIQVQAMLGDFYYGHSGGFFGGWEFSGKTSGWSNTQTINVPANIPLNSTPTPSSTTTPNSSNTPSPTSAPSTGIVTLYQSVIVILVILLSAVIVISVLFYRRHRP